MLSELLDLSERWFQAWQKKDAATVERLAAEDYIYIAPSGLVLDREAILAVIRSPTYRLDHGTRTEVVVRPWVLRGPWCATAIRAPARLRALPSRMITGVSWSGRNTLANGDL